jgi:hypothetical protein
MSLHAQKILMRGKVPALSDTPKFSYSAVFSLIKPLEIYYPSREPATRIESPLKRTLSLLLIFSHSLAFSTQVSTNHPKSQTQLIQHFTGTARHHTSIFPTTNDQRYVIKSTTYDSPPHNTLSQPLSSLQRSSTALIWLDPQAPNLQPSSTTALTSASTAQSSRSRHSTSKRLGAFGLNPSRETRSRNVALH